MRSMLIKTWTIIFFMTVNSSSEPRLFASGFEFPEGPVWDCEKNLLYCSNCYGDWLALVLEQKVNIFLKASEKPFTFDRTNGLALDTQGNLYACDFGKGAILKISPLGESFVLAAGYQGNPFHRPNDLAFSPGGDLYFTDPHSYSTENADGTVYKIDMKSHTPKPVAIDLAFPNGIAFSPEGQSAFICESAAHQVTRFRLNENGTLSDPRRFVHMPGGDPDGIAFDKQGNLYVAHFGGGAVYQFNPQGHLLRKIPMPGAKPTNLAFGGKHLKTLYITEVETQSIYALDVDVPGLPLYHSPAYKKERDE
jgi:gluconolactonase